MSSPHPLPREDPPNRPRLSPVGSRRHAGEAAARLLRTLGGAPRLPGLARFPRTSRVRLPASESRRLQPLWTGDLEPAGRCVSSRTMRLAASPRDGGREGGPRSAPKVRARAGLAALFLPGHPETGEADPAPNTMPQPAGGSETRPLTTSTGSGRRDRKWQGGDSAALA
ncbi:unnamed protein product [Rangifer tarandus platyrhynchus]|uniref:Uncharacterized protein n=2 Tax=Rangifer tarandus platyrhynchus TaxID=3082113 RepID=A0ABN8XT96_RANTA|nr:unnamed protein product [Rangifer tarandus platyrhynchus]CAI9690297.1 unnamed protein product [Rangifer tarandus platyrhynchus]